VCMHCHAPFGILRRRHHCRKCGVLVCSACSPARQVVPEYDELSWERVCSLCADPGPGGSEGAGGGWEEEAKAAAAAVAAGDHSAKPLSAETMAGQPVPSSGPEHREYGTLRVRVLEAKGLLAADDNLITRKSSDPYCILRVTDGPSVRTRTISSTLDPRWDTLIHFRLKHADAMLHLEVWDEDLVSKDDPIGSLELPLASIPAYQLLRGWVPLRLPEAQPLPGEVAGPARGAGAVFLELSLQDLRAAQHYKSYVLPLPKLPPPLPAFDIDAVYGPIMHLIDLVVSQFISPVVSWILALLLWTDPKRTLLALVTWNAAAKWALPHWPTAWWLWAAYYIFSHRHAVKKELPAAAVSSSPGTASSSTDRVAEASAQVQSPWPKLLRQKTVPAALQVSAAAAPCAEDAEEHKSPGAEKQPEESQLGSAVQNLCFVLPSSVKLTCRGLQPTLRTAADSLQMVHDIFVYDHPASPAVIGVFLVLALLAELLRYDVYLRVLGSLVFFATSPLLKALTGS
ncbi:unnamed protein product, partial [Polarella glacialis]